MLGLSKLRDKAIETVSGAQETLYKVILVLLTVTALLWMSIFLYASFYYSYIPPVTHSRPVNLQFTRSCDRTSNVMCDFPSANVTLTRRDHFLMVGQPYKILLELEMPESPANQKLGMFMACARLKSKDGDSVEESCRSAMIQYKSSFLHLISTVVLYPLLFSGSYEEKQLLAIELFSNFQEDSYNPVTDAHVELQSYTIEVYRASLKIHAHFTGLRFLMFHWPLTSAVMGICTNLFFLSVVAFLSWFKFFKPRQMTVHVGYDATKSKTLEERHAQAKERILSNQAKAAAAAPHLEIPKPQLNKEDLDPLFDEDEDEELTTLETSTELFDDEKDQVVPDLQGSGNSSTSDESERKSSSEFEVVGKTDEEDQGQHEKDFDEEKGQSKEDLESDIRQRKHK